MPFPQQQPRSSTRAGIEVLSPNQHGCYGIFRDGVRVYVGKGDIRARLLDHLNGGNPRITRERPTHYVAVVTADMDNEEKRLILALDPTANRRVG
jgi:hypothetical protein